MSLKPKRVLLALLLLVGFVGVGGLKAMEFVSFLMVPANSGSQDSLIIEVQKGQGAVEVARVLESKGVVKSARHFRWLGHLSGQSTRIKAGEYRLSAAMAPIKIFSVITSGVSISHSVTVREGENIFEIASEFDRKNLVKKTRFLDLCRDPNFIRSLGFSGDLPVSLEGYLFPDTYLFTKYASAEEIIGQMTRRFFSLWNGEFDNRAREVGLTRHQVVTLASIVEKETGASEERPLISSVFHNRLNKKMKLQSDPTTIYGIWETFNGNLQRKHLVERTPYNTYAISGLPIGPIGNPGREAILAALQPAKSDYLFFVSHNDGTHEFSRTFEEHGRAVTKYQLDRRARAGKSWRDLHGR